VHGKAYLGQPDKEVLVWKEDGKLFSSRKNSKLFSEPVREHSPDGSYPTDEYYRLVSVTNPRFHPWK
jgi:hypothetical protein